MTNKASTPTISDIRVAISETESYFFTRSTLNFFGQRMSDFRVRRSPAGRVYIYAPMRRDNKVCGYTFREYVPDPTRPNYGTLRLPRADDGNFAPDNSIDLILSFINAH